MVGNDLGDLDSTSSAISLAYMYSKLRGQNLEMFLPKHLYNSINGKPSVFIPLLQISPEERELKTDVLFSLTHNDIDETLIPDM